LASIGGRGRREERNSVCLGQRETKKESEGGRAEKKKGEELCMCVCE